MLKLMSRFVLEVLPYMLIGANRSDRCARVSDVAVSRKSVGGSFKQCRSYDLCSQIGA